MCGILFELATTPIATTRFERALELLDHRGPDAKGLHRQEHGNFTLTFGHTRLKIIDLDNGANQPFFSENREYMLIFNGEIYNYKEIRKMLEREYGQHFHTDSDTEVLLKALIQFGPDTIAMLNGMWSFVFYNCATGEIYFSRDNYGKKPLLFYRDGHRLLFASETKSILALLDKRPALRMDHLQRFLIGGVINTTEKYQSLYEGIDNIVPGTLGRIVLRDDGFEIEPAIRRNDILAPRSSAYTCKSLQDDVMAAVAYRLQSDRPVGVFISGGVDSSIVAACAALLNKDKVTYFTGDTGNLKNNHDLEHSLTLARSLGIQCTVLDCSPAGHDIFDINEEMTRQYDMPVSFMGNAIACYLMYKQVSNLGVRVVLDGTGGDEIFGGYYNIFFDQLVQQLLKQRKLATLYHVMQHAAQDMSVDHIRATVRKHLPLLLSSKHPDVLTDFQKHATRQAILPNWLFQNDNNAMRFSVENRSPLLDVNLGHYINMDISKKFRGNYNKYLLRQAMPGNVPDSIRWRAQKQGFRFSPNDTFIKERERVLSVIRTSHLLKELYQTGDVENVVGPIPVNAYSIARFEQIAL